MGGGEGKWGEEGKRGKVRGRRGKVKGGEEIASWFWGMDAPEWI